MKTSLTALLFLTFVIFCAPAAVLLAEPITFRIGVIIPLSGMAAEYGEVIRNSMELAKKDHPELLGHLSFVYEDVQYDPKLAISAFHKLRLVDKADLVYTFGVSFCKALAPIAEAAKFPLIGQCIDPNSSTGRHYVIRFMNYTDEYLAAQTKYLKARGLNRIGVILTDNPYLEEMYEALKRNLEPGQTLHLIERVLHSEMDLRAAIARARMQHHDVIGVMLAAGQISQFYRQAKQLNFSVPTFGTNFFESLTELGAAYGGMEGAVFAGHAVSEDFVKHYQARYGNLSQLSFGGPAYEFALLAGRLFPPLPHSPLSSEEILHRFRGAPQQHGTVCGPYRYVESAEAGGYFSFPIALKQVQGREFLTLYEVY